MIEEALDPILIQVTVPLPIPMIYSAFIDPAQLQSWMCDSAVVEPKVGGRFEVGWNEPKFTSRGLVTHLTKDVDLGFSWIAPEPFSSLMNEPTPRTGVYVRLQESPEGIDVTLEHSGWGSGDAWEEARSWHFHLWKERLRQLKDYLMKAAYG